MHRQSQAKRMFAVRIDSTKLWKQHMASHQILTNNMEAGDLNAELGRRGTQNRVIEEHGLYFETNRNGQRIADSAISKSMKTASKCFPHKHINKITCISPGENISNQSDKDLIEFDRGHPVVLLQV